MKIVFCPIASGSSGNCTYIGTEHSKILIDAGLSLRNIEQSLSSIDVNPSSITAIFVTHEHSDHTKGVGLFSRKHNVPIYATCGTWTGMESSIGKIAYSNINMIYSGEGVNINELIVKPFEIPHDANEPVGFNVFLEDIKFSVATDIGHATGLVRESLQDSDVVLLEANHDIDMLKNGRYPYILKKRILSDNGHLANVAAGNLLTSIVSKRLKSIYLGHLSKDNNHPDIAYNTVHEILKTAGKLSDFLDLQVADRFTCSKATVF